MNKATPRGIRNNNPGNIDYNPSVKWQGLADPPREPEGRFCRFAAPKWGIRAIARLLITYQDQHDLNTVRGIINRWAPPIENDSDAYVNAVASSLGVDADGPSIPREFYVKGVNASAAKCGVPWGRLVPAFLDAGPSLYPLNRDQRKRCRDIRNRQKHRKASGRLSCGADQVSEFLRRSGQL